MYQVSLLNVHHLLQLTDVLSISEGRKTDCLSIREGRKTAYIVDKRGKKD